MTHSNSSRRLLAAAVTLALATIAGPVSPPAIAAPATGTVRADSGAQPSAAAVLPPDTEVVMAGATGFLASTPAYDLLWIRYDDGSTTNLGRQQSQWRTTALRGSVSDVVAFEHGGAGDADHRVELRDMSTGAVSDVGLGAYRTLVGVVGPTVVTCGWTSGAGVDCGRMSLTDMVDGVQTDRAVTGLPDGAQSISPLGSAPGSLVLRYTLGGTGPVHHAVVDLTSGVATPSQLVSSGPAGAAVNPTYLAALGTSRTGQAELLVENRGTGAVTRVNTQQDVSAPLTGLVGDWALFGDTVPLRAGGYQDLSFRAVPVGGGVSRKILDHATSIAATPGGDLMVMGGTLAQGEGVYRVSPGADGVPAAELVAGTGQPMGITLVSADIPAVATLDPELWRARWQLSRANAEVTLRLWNMTTGASTTFYLSPSDPPGDPVGMDPKGLIHLDWTGLFNAEAAPNGPYSWELTAKPLNGLGRDLRTGGAFEVSRPPAPHDYTDNGSPDLLARDSAGVLWREDTVPDAMGMRHTERVKVGSGWAVYNRIAAVGDVGGAFAGDVVARDKAGMLWLYLGNGKGGFAPRTRIGAGWSAYTQVTGTGDFSGDGRADLVARDGAGILWLYKGTGSWKSPYAARTRVGGGWNTYDEITAVGNAAGGAAGDLVARDKAGVLWLYQGTGEGGFSARTRIGAGWNTYTQLIGMGDGNMDGRTDLLAVDREGTSWYYRGTGNAKAPFAARDASGLFFAQRYNAVG
ncbi:VCBS repeat-containing protein [Streptomyces sp. NPDC005426]|uniref:FG-GAP repeat domain-containing protein n=1 Tax=Streptomyces sp. NPDC005426 TaxID=3155344 RepID=UPI0033A51BFF